MINKIHGSFEHCWRYSRGMEFTFFKLISYSFAALTHEISIWHTKIDSMSSRTYALFSLFFLFCYSLDPGKTIHEIWFMGDVWWVWGFVSTECAEITRTISWLCITQKNSNLFQSCLKLEEINNENIYMLNAGPVFRWKGAANKLPVLLLQHGDK